MAGGVGERFWPYSRRKTPKQLLKITGDKSLLEEAIERLTPLIPIERIFIVTNRIYETPIVEQIPGLTRENIISEPVGRNTAACLALAEAVTSTKYPDATMAVITADHVIKDREKFIQNVEAACRFAEDKESIVTIGIRPTRPETGFGYIEAGEKAVSYPEGEVYRVLRFREKPDLTTAKTFLQAGNFYWNSGMFFWKNSCLRANLEKFLPDTMKGINQYRQAIGTPEEESLLERVYENLEKISIDFAVMEKAKQVYVVPADFDWDDVGTWNALERYLPADQNGNHVVGKALTLETSDTVVYNPERPEAPLVVGFGLDELLIVAARDVVMVCPKSRAPELKKLTAELRKKGMDEYL